MKNDRFKFAAVLFSILMIASFAIAQTGNNSAAQAASQTQAPAANIAKAGLEPVAWLIGDWHATAAPPDRPKTEVDNHIYWNETKTAIGFVTKFNGEVHYQGLYAYDPAAKKIRFFYVDTDGNLTQGTIVPQGERLFLEFTISQATGVQNSLVSFMDRKSPDQYHWQVLKTAQDTKPMIELDYTRKK